MEGLERLEELKERMAGYAADGDLYVAFSGGVDSALVLAAAMEAASPLGRKVYAVTFSTKLHGMGDLEAAERVARELGAVHRIIEVDELAQEEIRNNPRNRCYLCKKSLFVELKRFASEVGAAWCLEGTNGDDLHSWRPGLQALKELEIESPLALLGISKEEVRALAKQYGVSVAHRPSSPCMATRLQAGSSNRDITIVRLRLHGDVARIEVDRERFGQALMLNDDIVLELKKYGFHYVTLDLEGFRSGSMDE